MTLIGARSGHHDFFRWLQKYNMVNAGVLWTRRGQSRHSALAQAARLDLFKGFVTWGPEGLPVGVRSPADPLGATVCRMCTIWTYYSRIIEIVLVFGALARAVRPAALGLLLAHCAERGPGINGG